MKSSWIESSGNVFADLGLPDSEVLLQKSDLVIGLKKLLAERNLPQEQVANRIGLDVVSLSKLLEGEIEGVTIDRLLGMIARLGHQISINVNSNPEEQAKIVVRFRHDDLATQAVSR